MADILKLSEPGDECVMSVEKVEAVKGEFGAQYLFEGSSGNARTVRVYVPASSADRQAERLGLDDVIEGFTGRTIRISRSLEVGKNKKPFWNLDFTSAGAKPVAKPAPKAASAEPESPFPPSETGAPPKDAPPDVPASEVKRVARNAIEEAYAALYGRVAKWAQPGDVNAATATLWIFLDKRNLL